MRSAIRWVIRPWRRAFTAWKIALGPMDTPEFRDFARDGSLPGDDDRG